MPYEVFRKNFFAHMNELEITPGKVRLDEAIRLIVCQMSDFLVPYVISINYVCEANDTPLALHKEIHIYCISQCITGRGVNSNQ